MVLSYTFVAVKFGNNFLKSKPRSERVLDRRETISSLLKQEPMDEPVLLASLLPGYSGSQVAVYDQRKDRLELLSHRKTAAMRKLQNSMKKNYSVRVFRQIALYVVN